MRKTQFDRPQRAEEVQQKGTGGAAQAASGSAASQQHSAVAAEVGATATLSMDPPAVQYLPDTFIDELKDTGIVDPISKDFAEGACELVVQYFMDLHTFLSLHKFRSAWQYHYKKAFTSDPCTDGLPRTATRRALEQLEQFVLFTKKRWFQSEAM